ncbi:uncharacterized protein B0J16DRAFT_399851 [Fusarium flagelliforme]|uniref:uncharacterized protein n=1 Tax=Fusarium flagelliforme TaxID=2675880 RepID=UPI001E8DCAA5|nr:uncharacterized protein B0J16DRAFT_399851 [Fusarium flagelliforme]KAH7185994.1 hypothetical protein B0J16DRAFT_399851 [Fusarium flagelliforme]
MTDIFDNESVNALAGQTSGLGIVDGDAESQQPRTLAAAMNHLGQTTASLRQQLAHIETLFPGQSELIIADAPSVRMVYKFANDNKYVSELLNRVAIELVLAHIISLKNTKTTNTWKLLGHFDASIKAIAKKFISQPCDGDSMLKIVEECCIQAVPSGQLDPYEYLNTREGLSEQTKHDRCVAWARFWAVTLNSCPDGPTLFIPANLCLESETPQSPPGILPRFPFRACDTDCPGIKSKDIIASWGHKPYGATHSKRDIFSLSEEIASKMLYHHLNGSR